jgi:hypothetical protein
VANISIQVAYECLHPYKVLALFGLVLFVKAEGRTSVGEWEVSRVEAKASSLLLLGSILQGVEDWDSPSRNRNFILDNPPLSFCMKLTLLFGSIL